MDDVAIEWSDNMKKGNLMVSLIIIILINIGIFIAADDYSVLFWVNYSFFMTALLASTYIICFFAPKEELMNKMNISISIGLFLTAETIAALLCSFLAAENWGISVIIHLIILGLFIIIFYSTLSANSFIKQQQEKRKVELMDFKYILEKMKNIQRQVPYSASYKKEIDIAYDSLSSGQTSSSVEVEPIEKEIIAAIDVLNDAVIDKDEQLIVSTCNKLNQLSYERNSKLKLRSNF